MFLRLFHRWRLGIFAALLAMAPGGAAAADDELAEKLEIHHFGLWVADPTLERGNSLEHFPNQLPAVVESVRARRAGKSRIAPLAMITMHGEDLKDIEIDLRVNEGRFAAHWPPAESKSGRLRWFDCSLAAVPDEKKRITHVDKKHWFQQARALPVMSLVQTARAERFLLYDAEMQLPIPIQVRGGPDEYVVANRLSQPISDLIVLAPTPEGMRVGTLAKLPPAPVSAPVATPPVPAGAEGTIPARAEGTVPAAGATPGNAESPAEENAPRNRDAESDARQAALDAAAEAAEAAADAVIEAAADAAAAEAALDAAETDRPADTDTPPRDPNQPVADSQPGGAGQPAGAADAAAPATPFEGETLVLSAPIARDSAEWTTFRADLLARLIASGMSSEEADLFLSIHGPSLLETEEFLILVRLPDPVVEQAIPLVTYPMARRTVTSVWLAIRNIDPGIEDEVSALVFSLGVDDFSQREAAEHRLIELGRLALPVVRKALQSPDLEVQMRAERILLKQGQSLDEAQPGVPGDPMLRAPFAN